MGKALITFVVATCSAENVNGTENQWLVVERCVTPNASSFRWTWSRCTSCNDCRIRDSLNLDHISDKADHPPYFVLVTSTSEVRQSPGGTLIAFLLPLFVPFVVLVLLPMPRCIKLPPGSPGSETTLGYGTCRWCHEVERQIRFYARTVLRVSRPVSRD